MFIFFFDFICFWGFLIDALTQKCLTFCWKCLQYALIFWRNARFLNIWVGSPDNISKIRIFWYGTHYRCEFYQKFLRIQNFLLRTFKIQMNIRRIISFKLSPLIFNKLLIADRVSPTFSNANTNMLPLLFPNCLTGRVENCSKRFCIFTSESSLILAQFLSKLISRSVSLYWRITEAA